MEAATKGKIAPAASAAAAVTPASAASTVAASASASASASAAAAGSADAVASTPAAASATASASAPHAAAKVVDAIKETAKQTQTTSKKPAVSDAEDEKNMQNLAAKIAERVTAVRQKQAVRAAQETRSANGGNARNGRNNHATVRKARVAQTDASKEAARVATHAAHWDYEGEAGPAQWGKLNPDWAQCATGARQSPIDIRDGMRLDLEPIRFDYRPGPFSVVNNGHTVQVGVAGGNRITITGRTYELVQFHFHRPSEERINGKSFAMVVHLVHKDAEGRLAVVALLIEEGEANAAVQSVWNNLPLEKNEPVRPTIEFDPSQLLPARRDYYTYMGSLTTPPCSEGVLWLVMKEPIRLSAQQIAIFSRLYPMNARPIQADSGRLIKESN
ncbi:MAG: carbonic anhydrase family protein [Proteobacteria bacterium]|nr:carbonic anhydrase family protein [Pseudomonadota bacterium]